MLAIATLVEGNRQRRLDDWFGRLKFGKEKNYAEQFVRIP
jgi:hypothetical protein